MRHSSTGSVPTPLRRDLREHRLGVGHGGEQLVHVALVVLHEPAVLELDRHELIVRAALPQSLDEGVDDHVRTRQAV